jgi:hypothetical protein
MSRTDWTREEIEKLKGWERPMVRVRFEGCNREARIGTYLNHPYVEVHDDNWKPFLVSWELLLAVLNDRFEPPIAFDTADAERCWDRYK